MTTPVRAVRMDAHGSDRVRRDMLRSVVPDPMIAPESYPPGGGHSHGATRPTHKPILRLICQPHTEHPHGLLANSIGLQGL